MKSWYVYLNGGWITSVRARTQSDALFEATLKLDLDDEDGLTVRLAC